MENTSQCYLNPLAAALVALTLVGCAGAQMQNASGPVDNPQRVADLHVVDCLLPGQVRQLGAGSRYVTARRPVRATAADCRIRGGEYVAYDRASLSSSLAVWMPAAEAGDPEAMANVGEIFERGLGDVPNHEAAAIWYRKAAERGVSRAQFNLGIMYEKGLGVEQDRLAALNWYRRAWGLEADELVYTSIALNDLEAARNQFEQRIQRLERRSRQLLDDLDAARQEGEAAQERAEYLQLELDDMRLARAAEEEKLKTTEEQIAGVMRLREPQRVPSPPGVTSPADDMDFGRYFALVIGNEDYTKIDSLRTPVNDARRLATLLRDKYGFGVTLMLNATRLEVMETVNDLNQHLGENDNLLVYYAGHGARVKTGEIESGYWLPVNADAPPRDTFWVSNEFVTGHLARLSARRVLVIADSCYAGLLADSPTFLMMEEDLELSDATLRYRLPKRSRLLLSSGGDRPVLDEGAPSHSVFASVLLETLENNDSILSGPQLYAAIEEKVYRRAAQVGFDQRPEYKIIKSAGHEVGDFFFVPKTVDYLVQSTLPGPSPMTILASTDLRRQNVVPSKRLPAIADANTHSVLAPVVERIGAAVIRKGTEISGKLKCATHA